MGNISSTLRDLQIELRNLRLRWQLFLCYEQSKILLEDTKKLMNYSKLIHANMQTGLVGIFWECSRSRVPWKFCWSLDRLKLYCLMIPQNWCILNQARNFLWLRSKYSRFWEQKQADLHLKRLDCIWNILGIVRGWISWLVVFFKGNASHFHWKTQPIKKFNERSARPGYYRSFQYFPPYDFDTHMSTSHGWTKMQILEACRYISCWDLQHSVDLHFPSDDQTSTFYDQITFRKHRNDRAWFWHKSRTNHEDDHREGKSRSKYTLLFVLLKGGNTYEDIPPCIVINSWKESQRKSVDFGWYWYSCGDSFAAKNWQRKNHHKNINIEFNQRSSGENNVNINSRKKSQQKSVDYRWYLCTY